MTEKQEKALKTVKSYMWLSGGAGLIPFAYVDWVAVSGLQLKMLADISKIYDVPFHENLGKAAIGSLAGYIVPAAAAFGPLGFVLKSVPVLGSLAGAPAMAVFAGAYAWALGNVFIQHFESGGTFLDFNPDEVREHYRSQLAGGPRSGNPATT